MLADTNSLKKQLDEANKKHGELMDSLCRYMEENTRQIQDQAEYNRHFSELDAECQQAEQQIVHLRKKILAQSGS